MIDLGLWVSKSDAAKLRWERAESLLFEGNRYGWIQKKTTVSPNKEWGIVKWSPSAIFSRRPNHSKRDEKLHACGRKAENYHVAKYYSVGKKTTTYRYCEPSIFKQTNEAAVDWAGNWAIGEKREEWFPPPSKYWWGSGL